MTAYTDFIDITGSNFGKAPFQMGGVRAIYVTGTGGIEETAAQVAELRLWDMGAITIDQTPGLSVFAAGKADVADVEPYAGTDSSAHAGVAARQAHGLESALYVSYSNWPALKRDIANPAGVVYWVADYSWSRQQAIDFMTANPDVVSVQYGDPATNPRTLVPGGTTVTLAEAQADIDVALASWTAKFRPGGVTPPPPPSPTWQENMMRQLPTLARGATGGDVRTVQALCTARGQVATVDGVYGDRTTAAVVRVQQAAGFPAAEQDGVTGPKTWPVLMGV